jgi:hypothetical protein
VNRIFVRIARAWKNKKGLTLALNFISSTRISQVSPKPAGIAQIPRSKRRFLKGKEAKFVVNHVQVIDGGDVVALPPSRLIQI